MTNRFNVAVLIVVLAGAVSAHFAAAPWQMERALARNPDILIHAMRNDPSRFMAALNQVAAAAHQEQLRAENDRREEEFHNPRHPRLQDGRAVRGDANAPVTIVMYSDFQCSYCRQQHEVLARVLDRYEGQVRLLLKHLPSERHAQSLAAAGMFEAIALQSAENAWRFHDTLFANPQRLEAEGESFILAAARTTGIDVERARQDAQGAEVAAIVADDQREAAEFGFNGTPSLLINGVSFEGAYPIDDLARAIERHLGR
jgi:protein-disulfide isomerase